ncbi:NAD(P)-dependent oxidoreductase [Candidatus Bipolaricaulota bacterium]
MSQRIGAVSANQTQRRWKAPEPGVSLLRGKVLGILGVGAVGGNVADKAKCFGMRVLGLDMLPKQHPSLEKVYNLDDLDKFLGEVDCLVICLPLTSQTEGLLGRDQFAAMRKEAFLINVARGVIVKQSELVRALEDSVIGGAVLDVFEEEPLPSSSPLWHMRNVIVTPHIAGGASPGEMVEFFAANLRKYRRGETLQGIVDLELGF